MFFFAALSVWSNFTLLNYFISLLGLYNIVLLVNFFKKKTPQHHSLSHFFTASAPSIIVSVILLFLIIIPLKIIKGNLFGPMDGFYQNTMRSLVLSTTQTNSSVLVTSLCVFCFIVVFALAAVFIYEFTKGNKNVAIKILAVLLLLILPAFSTILQHVLLNTQFLESRTGVFFIVLFNINILLLVSYLSSTQLKRIGNVTCIAYSGFLFVNLITEYNLDFYNEWKYDSCTKKMLELVEQDHKASNTKDSVTIGITWLFEPTINFYKTTKKITWLKKATRKGYSGGYDYYYVTNDEAFFQRNKLISLQNFSTCNAILVKKQNINTVNIRATNGQFIIDDRNNQNKLFANSKESWEWETFAIIELGNNIVQIKSSTGKYVSVKQDSGGLLRADVEFPKESETFTLIRLGNFVAIQSNEKKYLRFDRSSLELTANSVVIGENEKFELLPKKY
jgi:hypothetical protein